MDVVRADGLHLVEAQGVVHAIDQPAVAVALPPDAG